MPRWTIRGITRGLRFHGTLRREGPYYRFTARFRVSRDVFGIHTEASWDGLIRDDENMSLAGHVSALSPARRAAGRPSGPR